MMTQKEQVRAWLFALLAKVEVADEVSGTRREAGGKVTLEIELGGE
jgi:hypothetical protein